MKEPINRKPIKNKTLAGGILLLLAATSAWGTEHAQHDHSDLYRAHELSVDVFGTASLGQYSLDNISGSRIRQDTEVGAGVGVNYFLTRNLGVGVDMYSEDTTGKFIDSMSGNVILRLPLGHSGFAPYAYGGGGYQFDFDEVWFAQFGGGIEYRFSRNWGAFLDARYVITDKTENYGLARLGVRFAF
jgi:Outer membrane protein beta-barrel domain